MCEISPSPRVQEGGAWCRGVGYARPVAADPRQSPAVTTRREGTNWRHWFLGAAVLLLLIVALQNSQEVEVEVLFVQTQAPLIAILLITALIGAAIGYVLPVLRRHRREERRRDEG